MAVTSGAFSATGSSAQVSGGTVAIDLSFSGGGAVAVEWCVDGVNWRPIATYDESTQLVYDAPGVPVRITCTNYAAPISYALGTR